MRKDLSRRETSIRIRHNQLSDEILGIVGDPCPDGRIERPCATFRKHFHHLNSIGVKGRSSTEEKVDHDAQRKHIRRQSISIHSGFPLSCRHHFWCGVSGASDAIKQSTRFIIEGSGCSKITNLDLYFLQTSFSAIHCVLSIFVDQLNAIQA